MPLRENELAMQLWEWEDHAEGTDCAMAVRWGAGFGWRAKRTTRVASEH